MGNSRKSRGQGIYAFPPEVRRAVDAMLAENLPYAVITQKVKEQFGLKTSPAALSGYFAKGFDREAAMEHCPVAKGDEKTASGTVVISITVSPGCSVQVSVTGGSPSIQTA